MPKNQITTCNKIIQQLKAYNNIIRISDFWLQPQEIYDIISVIDKDFPEIFYTDIKNRPVEISQIGFTKIIKIPFLYSVSEIKDINNSIKFILNDLYEKVQYCNSIDKKEKIIYDYITLTVKYDYSSPTFIDYTIIGPLLYKKGICEGYSKAFKFLCDYFDIPCLIVSGTGINPTQSESENHSWNIVKLDDGNFYHVDSTWDSNNRNIGYLYFNKSDSEIRKNHIWNVSTVPSCDNVLNTNQYPYFESANDLYRYLVKEWNLRKQKILFKVNHKFYSVDSVLDLISKMAKYYSKFPEAKSYIKNISVMYYKEQDLIKCEFTYYYR